MNTMGNRLHNGLLLVNDKYEPINRQRIPIIDSICLNLSPIICRHVTGKTTPLTLSALRQSSSSLYDITKKCERSRAYVSVGFSEHKSPMSEDYFAHYLHMFHEELTFCGFDVCFIQSIFVPNDIKEKKENTLWMKRYKKIFDNNFNYEKLKIVIEYNNQITKITKNSYINFWKTIQEDYKEWCSYE